MPVPRDQVAGGAPRALLLDGDRTSRAMIRALLEQAGWRADPSAADAGALRARGLPGARMVIADWPRLEPLWPTLLAARADGDGVPHIVALVDAGADGDARDAIAAGADDCLARPVRAADLAARLGVAARAAAARRGARGALAAARHERDRLAVVLSSLPDGLVILAGDGTVIEVNEVFCAMTGFVRDDLVGRRSLFPHWPEEERPRLEAALGASVRGAACERDVVLPRADGSRFPAIVGVAPARGRDGRVAGHVVTVKDVSARVRAERVRAALRRLGGLSAAGLAADVVLERVASELAVLAGAGAVLRAGTPRPVVVAASPAMDVGEAPAAGALVRESPIRVADEVWGAVAAGPAPGAALPEGLGEVLEAMAEIAAAAVVADRERTLRAASAGADPVTGLPDAQAFSDLMGREAERARRYRREVALVLIDIDGFRRVNDVHGHDGGDRVLREMAARLRAHVRGPDSLGRTGGDEFAWLLPETGERAAHDAAARLRRALAEAPFAVAGPLTVSVGIASGASAEGAADLYRQAEVALHWAKVSGRNRAVAYSFAVAEDVFARRGGHRAETPSLRAMRALAWAVDAKDPHTHRHSTRVADLAVALATALGWTVARAAQLREAGLVHDVGKIAVPDAILFKPGPLTPAEREEVSRHAEIGARIVEDVLSSEQAAWVRGHHERWDGGGYPDGLAGDEIPEEARLLALADSWDVIVSSRSYKRARGRDDAVAEVRRCAGSQFWPAAVDALERLVAAGAVPSPHGDGLTGSAPAFPPAAPADAVPVAGPPA